MYNPLSPCPSPKQDGLKSMDVEERLVVGDDKDAGGFNLLMHLPDETYYPISSTGEESMTKTVDATIDPAENVHDIVSILYGQVGTTAFASFYQALKDSQTKFIVRHMGYIPY